MTDCPGPGLSILVSRVALVAAWPAVPAAVLPTPALPVGTSPRRRAQQQLGKSCFRWKSPSDCPSALPWENCAMNGIAEDSLGGQ